MDSLTHLFLGGAIAAAIAPAPYRRTAILLGAALNTLPDLDVVPLAFCDDPLLRMTWHRSITHSLFVLPVVAWLLWRLAKRCWAPVRERPRRWFVLFLSVLSAHPLIDAFTVYGTQLFWPLPSSPTMWSSLFIVDPAFTLPLVLACVAAWRWRERLAAQRALNVGLALSGAYLAWSLLAKWQIDRAAETALAARGLQDAPRFSVPMPFNTLLWRVVAMTPEGFVEGERSLVADRGPMTFRAYRGDHALSAAADLDAVRRLRWFANGFVKVRAEGGKLVLSDLRMGAEPDLVFRFLVAERRGDAWIATPVKQLPWPRRAAKRLPAVWRRIWSEPLQAAYDTTGAAPAANASK